MPDINGKKIPQLDPLPADQDPLFVVGGEDGKGYSMGPQEVKDRMGRLTFNSNTLAIGTDIETVQTPGVYRIIRTNYNNTNYPNAPYFQGMFLSTKLGDVYLIVELTPGGDVLQHMHIPFSNYAILSRCVWPRHLSNNKREWFISWGAGIVVAEIDGSGAYTPRSIQDIKSVRYAGDWTLYLGQTSTNSVNPTVLNKFNLPIPFGFTTALAGYNSMKVDFSLQDYESQQPFAGFDFKQTIYYSRVGVAGNEHRSKSFTRDIIPSPSTGTFTASSWRDISGTPYQLTSDGTDLFFYDDAGSKHKITSTIV